MVILSGKVRMLAAECGMCYIGKNSRKWRKGGPAMNKKRTSVIFTGDIGFDRYMDKKWEDEGLLSPAVLDFFHSADHTVANVEGALIDLPEDSSRSAYFHRMDPAATVVLRKMGALRSSTEAPEQIHLVVKILM